MDSLKRWREPATWVVLIAVVLDLVLVVADLLVFAGPDRQAATVLAYRVANPTMIIVLAALVATCVLVDRTPRARLLTLLSMIVTELAVLLALILTVVGLTSWVSTSLLDLFTLLTTLAVPVVGVGLLIKLWQLQPVPDRAAELALASAPMALDAPPTSPPPDPQRQPTWSPDVAAGAVWRTAGEAAAGAPASGWGQAGPEARWQPIPTATGQPPEQTGPPPPDWSGDTGAHRWSS